ncbi:unnamed protein product [Porites lobata]|uniref:Uncharacterized protein n=1 Tax=Porites lobata TaxID=104759 RepID=A0ABN8R3P9_9CNID|nr:unnamed protein product [Porites lobata]
MLTAALRSDKSTSEPPLLIAFSEKVPSDNIYKLKICCFIHRMRNETESIPDIFLDVLTPASRVHNHNTRFFSNLNYFRPRVSTNLGKTSFKFSAPKIWATVPPGLKCLPYHKFKKEWKFCLLTNQI